MDTNEQKNKLTQQKNARIAFLNTRIKLITDEYNYSLKVCQDEIDSLTIETTALDNFDVADLPAKVIVGKKK